MPFGDEDQTLMKEERSSIESHSSLESLEDVGNIMEGLNLGSLNANLNWQMRTYLKTYIGIINPNVDMDALEEDVNTLDVKQLIPQNTTLFALAVFKYAHDFRLVYASLTEREQEYRHLGHYAWASVLEYFQYVRSIFEENKDNANFDPFASFRQVMLGAQALAFLPHCHEDTLAGYHYEKMMIRFGLKKVRYDELFRRDLVSKPISNRFCLFQPFHLDQLLAIAGKHVPSIAPEEDYEGEVTVRLLAEIVKADISNIIDNNVPHNFAHAGVRSQLFQEEKISSENTAGSDELSINHP